MQRKSILLLLIIVLTLGSGGQLLAQDAMEPQPGGTLRAAWQAEWESLDPHIASSEATFQILNNVLETLTFFDDDINVIPWLAESWERSDDGLTWTFQLREGVTFSNGDELTAEDVKWSFERIIEVESGNLFRIGGADTMVEAVDTYTVAITTTAPVAMLPAALAANKSVGIMSSASVEDDGTVNVPIGSGPFVISEVEGTTRLVLTKNENYWQEGVPYLDAVEITPVTDDTSREQGLIGGEYDWIFTIPPQNFSNLEANEDVVVETAPRLAYDYFGLNLNREPFSDVRVRQAIAYAIDRQQICDFAFFGLCTAIQGPTGSGTPWYYPYAPYDRDLDMARQLLSDAGYADGFTMQIMPAIGFEETLRGAQIVQQQLSEIGITVEITPEEFGTWLERQGNGDFDAFMLSWIGLTDVEDYYYLQHRTGQSFNFTGYSNEAFDALVDEGRTIDDFDERYAVYEQANQMLVDDAPYIYMYVKREVKAYAPYVHGYVTRSDSANNFWTVWLEQ
ncbi:MAG: ABC transporter substrate-binding protein [Anaerolineaceae bacterium]|nr:ABC transporter substrate-binding protein [Anaerolineaceae bacterium]